jgi:hypothetical protein
MNESLTDTFTVGKNRKKSEKKKETNIFQINEKKTNPLTFSIYMYSIYRIR